MSLRLPLISSTQCKRARAMLKWNPTDLASRTRIQVKRVEMFERNQLRLTKPENDEIVSAFHNYHIDFRADGEVVFNAGTPTQSRREDRQSDTKSYTVTLADGITQVPLAKGSDWGEDAQGG